MGHFNIGFLERTICCKVKTNRRRKILFILFLERTICCKVKTEVESVRVFKEFLERTICCKVKTVFGKTIRFFWIFRKNNLL